MGQGVKAVVCAAVALVAAPLAAQPTMPHPASDNVEVEVAVTGSAKVPAQGFRFSAFLPQQAGGSPLDREGLVRRLKALATDDREVCTPSYPLGFVGNPLLSEEEPLDEAAAPATATPAAVPDGSAPGWDAFAPFPYVGVLASEAALEDAKAVLAEYHLVPAIVQPVLFECAAANEQAKLDALVKSADEAAILARALGMRVGGVTRIKDSDGSEYVVLSALSQLSQNSADGTVEMQVALRVTYRLDKERLTGTAAR